MNKYNIKTNNKDRSWVDESKNTHCPKGFPTAGGRKVTDHNPRERSKFDAQWISQKPSPLWYVADFNAYIGIITPNKKPNGLRPIIIGLYYN